MESIKFKVYISESEKNQILSLKDDEDGLTEYLEQLIKDDFSGKDGNNNSTENDVKDDIRNVFTSTGGSPDVYSIEFENFDYDANNESGSFRLRYFKFYAFHINM